MTKIFIHQSAYIPYIGFFYYINCCDKFVILDSVDFSVSEWQNKNYIINPQGKIVLSVPVENRKKLKCPIYEKRISNFFWVKKHLKTFELFYKRSKNFDLFFPLLENIYLEINNNKNKYKFLSNVNHKIIFEISKYIWGNEIVNKIFVENEFRNYSNKADRIIDICNKYSCNEFLYGPGTNKYLDQESKNKFFNNNIILKTIEYKPIEYKQMWTKTFIKNLSIIDLLFNCNKEETILHLQKSI